MGEIKSTLDLVLEKTRHLSLSSEEKQDLAAQEIEKRIKGMLQKYQNGLLTPEELKSEYGSIIKDDKLTVGRILIKESIGRLDLLKANRVVPVVGDFLGEHALEAVGADMKARGLQLGVFYTSNVEQYLFPAKNYEKFVRNIKALPLDSSSLILRVWFDQGKAHPRQRKGHRTTSLLIPLEVHLERWEKGLYKSYWDIATDEDHDPGAP